MKQGRGGCFTTSCTFLHILSEVYSATYLVVSHGDKVLKMYCWFRELFEISFTLLTYREDDSYVTAD